MVAERKVYTLKEAADVLGVSYATVQKAVREGQIPAIRFGRNTIRIPKDALDRWLMEKATAATRS